MDFEEHPTPVRAVHVELSRLQCKLIEIQSSLEIERRQNSEMRKLILMAREFFGIYSWDHFQKWLVDANRQ